MAARILFWAVTALAGLSLACVAPAAEVLRIDSAKRFQTIDHFGASDAWAVQILANWAGPAREHVADLLFDQEKGIGLSQWRFHITSGRQPQRVLDPLRSSDSFETAPGQYDFSRNAGPRWMLAAAKARGVTNFLAFSYSGTPRMTANGFVTPDAGPLSTNLKPDAVDAYATYLADVVDYFAHRAPEAERVTFGWLSPLNEPQWDWNQANQDATRASNADIKRVDLAVDRALRARNLPTRIAGVESANIPDLYGLNAKATSLYQTPFGDYLRSFCADPDIARAFGQTIGYHSYWSDDPKQGAEHRRRLRERLNEFPGWSIWQTEYCRMEHHRDLGMATALNVAAIIHADLADVGVSAWDWWLALSVWDYRDGLLFSDWKQKGDPETVIVPKLFWAFGNYSRFIRPGAVRVAIDAPGGLLGSAYINPNGDLVAVLVNRGDVGVDLTLPAADGQSFSGQQVFVTDAEHDLKAGPRASANELIQVPPKSVVTVVLKPLPNRG